MIIAQGKQGHTCFSEGFLCLRKAVGKDGHHSSHFSTRLPDSLDGLQAAAPGANQIFHYNDPLAGFHSSFDQVLASMPFCGRPHIDHGQIEGLRHQGTLSDGSCGDTGDKVGPPEAFLNLICKSAGNIPPGLGIRQGDPIVAIYGTLPARSPGKGIRRPEDDSFTLQEKISCFLCSIGHGAKVSISPEDYTFGEMYKVYFNDRFILLTEDRDSALQHKRKVLYRDFTDRGELKHWIIEFRDRREFREAIFRHNDLRELQEAFKSCFKLVPAAGGLVQAENGSYLVIERNGFWDLPKGKLEEGESFEDAALREVEEETGLEGLRLRCLLMSTFHTYPLSEDVMALKETRWFDLEYGGNGAPRLQTEEGITSFRWILPGEAHFVSENSYASILDVLRLKAIL
jgi:8-oxo-dGTP pyrophosphatase MutT (NUDIX family)